MTAPRVIVVSGGNAAYAELLEDWFAALAPHDLPVGILDVGLAPGHADAFRRRGAQVVEPGWDLPVPDAARAQGWFRAMTARPFLPRHFPGYDIYLWIDADAWVQERPVLAELAARAEDGRLAIVEERYHPAGVVFDHTNADGTPRPVRVSEAAVRRNLHQCYALFGPAYAEHHRLAILNSGVFALRGDAPAWALWAEILARGLRRDWHPLMEQQALTIAVLDGRIAAAPMPRRCNWNAGAELPVLDLRSGRFLTADERLPIGILHLQELKRVTSQVLPGAEGGMVRTPLTFRAFSAAMARHRQAGLPPP